MGKIAIYAGTFDPVTLGHMDIAGRAAVMFDELVIAVAASPGKKPMFNLDERASMIAKVLESHPNIKVEPFEGLLVKFAGDRGASVLVRGLRGMSDVDHEMQLATLNRAMSPEIETVFLAADPRYSAISSTMVREISNLDGDVTGFVPPLVQTALQQRKR